MYCYLESNKLVLNENNNEYELPFIKHMDFFNNYSDELIQDIANSYRLRNGKTYNTRSKMNYNLDVNEIINGALSQVKSTSIHPNDTLAIRPGFIEISSNHLQNIKRASMRDAKIWEYVRFHLDPSYECIVYQDDIKTIIYSRDIVWSTFRPYQTIGYRFDKTSGLFTTRGIGKNSRSIMEHTFRM